MSAAITPTERRRRRAGEFADADTIDTSAGTPAARRRHRAGEQNLSGYAVGDPAWRRRHRSGEDAELAADAGYDD